MLQSTVSTNDITKLWFYSHCHSNECSFAQSLILWYTYLKQDRPEQSASLLNFELHKSSCDCLNWISLLPNQIKIIKIAFESCMVHILILEYLMRLIWYSFPFFGKNNLTLLSNDKPPISMSKKPFISEILAVFPILLQEISHFPSTEFVWITTLKWLMPETSCWWHSSYTQITTIVSVYCNNTIIDNSFMETM